MNNDIDPKNYFRKIGNQNTSDFNEIIPNFIKKKTLIKGFGKNTPIEGQELQVHYIGELPDERNVDNTYISKEPHTFILGKDSIVYGLELGIKTMTMGEKALLLVEPEYGHLPLEQFKNKLSDKKYMDSVMKIDFEIKDLEPQEAKKYLPILYEVELIFIDKPRQSKTQLNTKEKIEVATELKEQGIASFKINYFQEAEKYFSEGLSYLTQIPSNELILIQDIKLTLILNICNCLIHLNQYAYALQRLEQAFKIKVNSKCYYYRALARMHLAEFEQAEKDIEKLADYMPGEQVLKTLQSKLIDLKNEYHKKTSKLVKNSMNVIYDDKANSENIFPQFSKDSKCVYLDLIKNNNTKNPVKLKFEIYKEEWAYAIIKAISSSTIEKLEFQESELKEERKIKELSLGKNYNLKDFDFILKEIYSKQKLLESEKKPKVFLYRNNIFPCSCLGLICLKFKEKSDLTTIEVKDYCELLITLEGIDYEIREGIIVLGKCFYNHEFLEKLTREDSISLISQGISVNIY